MKIVINALIFILIFCANSNCQNLRWRDIYDCDFSNGIVNPSAEIDCSNFFQLKDSCSSQNLIMWNWTSQPGIKNMDSIGNMISYPKEAERSNISGSVFIRVLIDKNGEVFCYQVLSELGECFNKEGERLIKHLKFNIATIDNKAVAYEYSFPITFKPEELKKKR